MGYQLNQKALVRLKALVRDGHYVEKPWSFTAPDSNALLGNPANWTEYSNWFLGRKADAPDPSENPTIAQQKDWYEYPFGKGGVVYLTALREIISRSKASGENDVADAAQQVLEAAQQKDQDKAQASASQRAVIQGAADPADRLSFSYSVPVTIQAAADGGDGAGKGPPTFAMDAYNGGPMQLNGWRYPVVVDLPGMKGLGKSRPIFRDHDEKKIVGHTTSVAIKGSTLKAAGIISGHGPHAEEVVGTSQKQFPWQASIGAKVLHNEFVPEGETAQANGRTWQGPVNIARQTLLREISFVPLGADDTTSARIAAAAAGDSAMKFKAWAKAAGLKCEDMDAEAMKAAKATFKAAYPDGDPDDDGDEPDGGEGSDDGKEGSAKASAAEHGTVITATGAQIQTQIRASHVAEYKRIAAIEKVAASHPEIAAKAVEEGWDEQRTELEVLRANRPQPKSITASSFGINTGKGVEINNEIVAAAAAMAGGVQEKYALSGLRSDNAKEIACSSQMRRNVDSIIGLCHMIAAANGVHLRAARVDDDVIRAMFQIDHRQQLDIRADGGGVGGFSTLSLSGITQNLLNKSMLQAYGSIDSVLNLIAWQRDTNDFKAFNSYRLTASGTMQPVGPTGELKSLSLQDETYSNQVTTRGCIVNVPRPIFINDDMGALAQIPTVIGRQAALTLEKVLFTTFLALQNTLAPGASVNQTANGFNFFSSGASNYMSGASSALSITAVTAAVQLFLQQTDANGDPINVLPDRLLVPPALRTAALELFKGTTQIATALGSTSAKATQPSINVHADTYKPVTSPFLANRGGKGLPGSSDSAWWLLPDPAAGFAPVQVGYLRGQRVPTIERGESNFNTLGIAMRCFFDFGVAPHDYRCAVMSAGQ